MDFSKIFLKNACPTSIGGQAVIEGVMMRGLQRTATALRLPDGRIYVRTEKNRAAAGIWKLPLIRGVVSFVISLVLGISIINFSADVQAYFDTDEESAGPETKSDAASKLGKETKSDAEEPGRFERFLLAHFTERQVWNFMMVISLIIAFAFAIGVFVILPTWAVSFLKNWIHSSVALNLIEGLVRIVMFVIYILVISRMEDIRRVFEYHGAEHKTIHCFENGLDLTAENAQQFYTLHPRCGTSFLMFVMVISLVLFSLLGWPSLAMRILSRILLMPVVASLSYEVLRWAGRSSNPVVEFLSLPGLLLQKLTTREPDEKQLEIGICALKSVLVPDDTPYFEGFCDKDGHLLEPFSIAQEDPS